jgi:uncharacterized protein YjbI with pentapeptide repeats
MGLEGKTLWDWISLLSVPSIVGFASLGFAELQTSQERARAQEVAFQAYIDRVSELLLRDLDTAQIDAVGAAHTRAILELVDGNRAGKVLLFLEDLDLITRFAAQAEGLDLDGAELKDRSLDGLDFEGSSLRHADFEGSSLRNADFEEADLTGADFKRVDLRGADFEGATLRGGDFDLADLRGANLVGAVDIPDALFEEACLDPTTQLPPGADAVTGRTSGCFGIFEDD